MSITVCRNVYLSPSHFCLVKCFLVFFFSSNLSRAVGSPLVMDPNSICRKTKRLAGKQAELCQTEPEIVQEVAKGARLGVRECQYQFRFRRWNCTSHSKYFGKILQQGEQCSFCCLARGLLPLRLSCKRRNMNTIQMFLKEEISTIHLLLCELCI